MEMHELVDKLYGVIGDEKNKVIRKWLEEKAAEIDKSYRCWGTKNYIRTRKILKLTHKPLKDQMKGWLYKNHGSYQSAEDWREALITDFDGLAKEYYKAHREELDG